MKERNLITFRHEPQVGYPNKIYIYAIITSNSEMKNKLLDPFNRWLAATGLDGNLGGNWLGWYSKYFYK